MHFLWVVNDDQGAFCFHNFPPTWFDALTSDHYEAVLETVSTRRVIKSVSFSFVEIPE